MSDWRENLIVAPVLLPLAASALILLFGEGRGALRRAVAISTAFALLAISVALLKSAIMSGEAQIYRIGDWPAPFAITLVLDGLSAMMLVLSSVLGCTSLLYASARWDRAGPRFHALVLLQLMGLNGAFLTGDLFNLFVFFEVLLAASYGLLLHGAGRERVSAALHYVSINVAASLLFLIGASLLYGVTGTLNIADLALRIPAMAASDAVLLQSGIAILAVAFFLKAGMWPLGFWLPATYSAATPPSAALFAILSKVGVYAALRVLLLVPAGAGSSALPFLADWLRFGGMITIAFGSIGLLSSNTLSRLAGYSLVISTGILLATIGEGERLLAGALFYLASSTLAVSAFYLLTELVGRSEIEDSSTKFADPVFEDEYQGVLEKSEESDVGIVIPGTLAIIGGGFLLTALLLAGLPPLSGFIGKVALLDALLNATSGPSWSDWTLIVLIILSGLVTVIATSRAGIDFIWTPDTLRHDLRIAEAIPISLLLGVSIALTVFADPVFRYMDQTARGLQTAPINGEHQETQGVAVP